ncbi:MAG: hypothetical protein HKL95_09320 [Phycisphaerae bacterium]|nr:hypothetical protein [Phycisphaerae bacterium]
MELTWQHPALLFTLALPLMLGLAIAGLRRARSGAGKTGVFTEMARHLTAIAMLAMLLLILAAAEPVIHLDESTDQLVVLIDRSAAARTAGWQTPAGLRQMLLRHLSPKTRVTLVTFGHYPHLVKRNVVISRAGDWPRRWPATQHLCGRLGRALAWRDLLAGGPGRDVPRWLLTTGFANWPHLPGSQKLQLPYFLTVSTARPKKPDAGILSFSVTPLSGSPAKKPGFTIRVGIAATGPMRLDAKLQRDGVAIAAANLQFNRAGEKLFTARDFPPAKNAAARYSIYLKTGDPWAADDSASCYAPPIGPARILLVSRSGDPASVSRRAGAGTRPKFDSVTGATRILPQAFPDRVAMLAKYQLILLDNIARSDLPAGSARAIMRYVTKTGGGLLIASGSRGFGPGGYALPTHTGTRWPVEQLSPLASAPPRRSARDVVFLVD